MCSVFEARINASWLSRALVLAATVWSLGAHATVQTPDSLTKRSKQTINSMAESSLERYIELLKTLAELTSSDEDADWARDFIQQATAGEERMFRDPDATVESNIDPELRADALSRNRKAPEYLNDFDLMFKPDGEEAVSYKLLTRGEPKVVGGLVSTRLLYEVKFNGQNEQRPGVRYQRHERVAEMIAERASEGNWRVTIATDGFYDSTRAIVQFSVDRDLAALEQGTITATPELIALRDAEAAERQRIADEKAAKKLAYADALQRGNELLLEEDYEGAIELFQQAAKFDPLSVAPLVAVRKTKKVWEIRIQKDKKRVEELLQKATELQSMREYERGLLAVQEAMKVIPDDPRYAPLHDTLRARATTRADREAPYNSGNYEACIKATKDRLQRSPMDVEAMVLLAKCYHRTNKPQDAMEQVNRALKSEPYYGEALFLRAELFERKGTEEDLRKASLDYDLLVRHDPWNMVYVQRWAALSCFRMQNCHKASELLKEALEREPNNAETLYWLGRVHGFGNTGQLLDYKESLKYLNRSVEVDSVCGKCYLERGVTLLKMDSVASATRSVEHARRFKLPEEEWRRVRYLAKKDVEDAMQQQQKGFGPQAAKLFTSACVLHPDTAIYWAYNAGNLMKLAQYNEAIVALDRYIALVDADYKGRLDKAYCLLKLGRYDEALDQVARVQRNDPKGDFAASSNRIGGEASFLKGDLAEAERALKESYRRDKEDPEVLSMLAKTTYARGSYKDAEDFAESAIQATRKAKGPEDPGTHFYLGLIQQKLGDAKKSIQSFEEARSYGYKSSEVQKAIGNSRMLLEDWNGAIMNFQEVIRDTLDREAVTAMAECLKREKKYVEALKAMSNLEQKQPDVADKPEFLAEMGLLYVVNGMMDEANKAIQAAYAADPDYMNTILARIAMYWKGARQEEAVKELAVLVDRGQITEKRLKNWPVLNEMIDSTMWKKRGK